MVLTTNGSQLVTVASILKAANVKLLNISLDTLDADKFQIITRRDGFQKVMDNIHLMIERNLHVKVNVVVMKGINDHEINDFVAWTKDLPVHVRFIEFMPFEGNRWSSNQVFTMEQMLEVIGRNYTPAPLQNDVHDTAKKYSIEGHKGTFAIISTMSSPFCSGCKSFK